MPERHLFVVLSNPEAGRAEEYNEWYSDQHLADLLKVPGIVSAQRFALSEHQRAATRPEWGYLALYEIETDDLKAVVDELGRRSGTALMPVSSAMSATKQIMMFQPITPKLTTSI